MKTIKTANWKLHLDEMIKSETSMEYKPFPKQYLNINIDKPIVIKQISTKIPSIHVIAKITEDFEAEVNAQDEEALPPRVFCWNDVSTLSLKVAFKTISAGLESEYRKIVPNVTFDIKSFSSTSRSTFPDNPPDYLVYHIINPSLSESPVAFKSSKIKYSFSNSELSNHKMKKSSIRNLVSFPESIDATSLRQLGESISGPSIFIFDCPNAVRLLENIISPNGASNMTTNITKEIFAFGATSGILPCSSQLPYDLFTSCLLTPAKVAILMQTKTYADLNCGVLSPIDIQELINTLNNSSIADKMTDSLEKALEQFADRIAFESLENNNIPLFELVFRRDPFIANLFYHYLFACRVMKCISTTPFCYPYLPDMTNHPLWDTFDLEVDRCLFSLRKNVEMFSIDSLLERQMRLLEDWMAYPIENREMPDELSYLAMLLDSPKYFERAIHFTAQFLSISAATTEKFLNTRAFPVLIHKIPHLYSYILTFCDEKANPEPKKVDKNENDTQNSEDDKNDNKNEDDNNNNNNNDNDNSNNNNDNNNDNDNIKIRRSKSEGAEVASTTKGDDSTAVLSSSSSYIIPKEKEEAFADFSFSIASSILLSPDLRPCFNNYLPFWEKLLNLSTSERLIVSCLSCLIQFDMNRNDANLDLIKSLSKHKSSQVRTLAHFLLKKMKVPLDLPMCKVSDEEDPFCRLALVSRISESINEDNKHDLIFDLVLSLGDLFSFVREEAIITLAQAIEIASKDEEYLEKIDLDMNVDVDTSNQSFENSEMNSQSFKFFESLKTFFKNFREDEIQNPIVLSLAREISFLTYDPSNRVRKRFSELLYFLESILFMEPTRRRSQAAIQASQNSNNASKNNNDNSSNINDNNNNDKSNKINDNNNDKSNKINDNNNNDKSNNTSTNNNDNTSNNNSNISTTNNGSVNGNENADSGNKSAAAAVDDHSANIRLSETARNSKTSSEPKKGGVPSIRPRSNLFAHCLSAIVHYTPEASDDCYGVSHNDLTSSLAGTPAVSPSGLIACPSTDGGIICQTHSGLTSYFDFFNQPVQVPPRFSGLVGPRAITPLQQNSNALRRRKCTPTYVEFIDDEKLLAVSDASQVIVIDIKNRINNNNNINKGGLYNTIDQTLNASQGVFGSKYRLNNSSFYSDFLYSGDYMKSEPACSFWMEHPDNCFSVRADYNSQNFHLLEHQVKPESCKIAIFDLASQRRIQEFLISRNPPTLYTTDQSIMMSTDRIIPATSPQENWCIGWLQSFSPLFFTCTNKLIIYDERVGNPVRKADLNLEDDYVMGCNSAIAMPLNLVIAKRKGSLAMVDFRTMSIVDEVNKNASLPPGKRIAMFKVHREIPFGFGTLIDNSAFTTMFDSGSLSINFKETSLPIHSFALHATEAACVARSGSCAKFLDVRLD